MSKLSCKCTSKYCLTKKTKLVCLYLDIKIFFGAESRIFEGAGGVSRTPGAGGPGGVHRPGDHIAALAIVTHVISEIRQ